MKIITMQTNKLILNSKKQTGGNPIKIFKCPVVTSKKYITLETPYYKRRTKKDSSVRTRFMLLSRHKAILNSKKQIGDNPTKIFKRSFVTTDQNNTPTETSSSRNGKKKDSSVRTLLIFRIIVVTSILIFLGFTFLFSTSFDFNYIYQYIIKFCTSETFRHKVLRTGWTSWNIYINIWGAQQWIVSVGGLIPIYIYIFYLLSVVKLIERPLTNKEIIFLIITDFLLNLLIGLLYMPYPNTVIGALMRKCPVALSPYILLLETILLIIVKKIKKKTHIDEDPKNT